MLKFVSTDERLMVELGDMAKKRHHNVIFIDNY